MRDGPVSAPGSPRLLPVIANQCVGALQRVSLCGERSPKGALLPPGLQTAGSMADFGATRCGNPRLRREAWQAGTTSGKFVYAFPYSPKVFPFTLCCCKENGLPRRFAPRNDMQKHAGWGCIIPGTAGILPENAPATAVPEQISAYPSRQTPLHPRTRPSFCMSLRTSAHTGVAIRSPHRETWQGGGSLGEFVTPYEFAQSTAVFCALPRGYGLPRRFAPRHDMQKHAGWGCIIPGAAGILPENAPATAVPEQISAYPSRQTPLHPRTRPSFCMSLRTSAWGPCKGCPFAGRGAPRERCSPPGLQTAGSMADFGATRCGNPFSPQGNLARWRQFGRIRYALRIRPKYCCFLRPAAGLRIATSLCSSP